MAYPVEVTLFRDMRPRSRPTPMQIPDYAGERVVNKLFPGSASNGEHLTAIIIYAGQVVPGWPIIRAQFLIEGVAYSDPRPGTFYTGITDMPSGLVHFLPMAPPDNPLFGGVHTLALRTMR